MAGRLAGDRRAVNLAAMTLAFLALGGARITGQASLRRLVSFVRAHCPAEEFECHVIARSRGR